MERIERKWRDDLPAGPWNDEPDKIQWPDPATGLACMIRRGPMGNLCGYVGVDETHPLFGKDYEDVDVDVHGGLTYASPCDGDEEQGICHVPGPGEPEPLWWFGFDCGHFTDVTPRFLELHHGLEMVSFEQEFATYRTVDYVTRETENLALQLAAAVDG